MASFKKVLLTNTSGKINSEGDNVKAIGFDTLNTNKRMMTLDIHTLNLTGRIYLYGSLVKSPSVDTDWFEIKLGTTTNYLEFNNFGNAKVIRESQMINLYGSYMWLKAKLDRSYIDVIETPVASNYVHVLTGANITSDTSITMNNTSEDNLVQLYPLDKLGIVEYINLCY